MSSGHDLTVLERVRAGEAIVALIQTIPSATLSELAVWCGYDMVVLDCEHGIMDEAAQLGCLQVVSHARAACGVRVRPDDFAAVGRYLDWGADAILLADVKSPAAAAAFVAAAAPGPHGTGSSTGSSRAKRYGLPGAPATPDPLLLALIESAAAVEQIDTIARTPGLDGVVVGPNDLSADLACPGDFAHADYAAAFAKVAASAQAAGVILGAPPHPEYPPERLMEAGCRLIVAGSDIAAARDGLAMRLAEARRPLDVAKGRAR
jgi:2-keto-3-deoxy-L-rhamnonate aldolase RhmA